MSRFEMSDRYSWSACGVLVACLSFAPRAHAQCQADAQCGAGKVCVAGHCQSATMTCGTDADCPGDDVCEAKRCAKPAPNRAVPAGTAAAPAAPAGAGAAPAATPVSGDHPPPVYAAPSGKAEKRRSTGMMVGGIVVLGVGSVSLLAGVVTVAAAQNATYRCNYDDYTDSCHFETDEGAQAAGIVMMVVGGAAVAVGLPLLLVGVSKVPVEEESAWYTPDVRVGLRGALAEWRF